MNDSTKLLTTSSNNSTLTHGATILIVSILEPVPDKLTYLTNIKMLDRWKWCISLIYQDIPQELAKPFNCLAAGYRHPYPVFRHVKLTYLTLVAI